MRTSERASSALDLATRVAGLSANLEAFVQDASITSINISKSEVETFRSARTKGVAVRHFDGTRIGHSYTTDLSDEGLRAAVKSAIANSRISSEDDFNSMPDAHAEYPQVDLYDQEFEGTAPERKVSAAKNLERLVLEGKEIRATRMCTYSDRVEHLAISSSTGIQGAYSSALASCAVTAIAQRDEDTQSGSSYVWGRNLELLDLEAAALEASTRAARMLGASKVPTATVPAVFSPEASIAILGVLATAASGEAAARNQSPLIGRLGERVASPVVRVVDDGVMREGISSGAFDGEGAPRRRTVILSDGVFETFLNNSVTARKLGASSTANASRSSFKVPPFVAASNFCLEPGSRTPGQLISSIADGFYVQELIGVHSGVNPVTGQFSVGASGLWISGGEIGAPVKEVTVGATLFDLLAGIREVADDFRLIPGFLVQGSFGSPTILIEQVTVAGI